MASCQEPGQRLMEKTTHHFLIGLPASGKSTFAEQLAKLGTEYTIISTDQIRGELFGDESIQGNWLDIEKVALARIKAADESGNVAIYDATNVKREYRLDFLGKVNKITGKSLQWMAWQLDTPLEICQRRNQERARQVPPEVIDSMNASLTKFSEDSIKAEGFFAFHKINLESNPLTLAQIQQKIKAVSRSIAAKYSRTVNYQLHQYSRRLDFERLMHLISLILHYPGVGNLQTDRPDILSDLFGKVPKFKTSVAEVAAMMAELKDPSYSNADALADDLAWLKENCILGTHYVKDDIKVKFLNETEEAELRDRNYLLFRYSDFSVFQRLMKIIRYIAHYPLNSVYDNFHHSRKTLKVTQPEFMKQLHEEGIVLKTEQAQLRKDIQETLNPYQILPERTAMKRGYFVGTGIFSEPELEKIYGLLKSQKIHTDDPIAVRTIELFEERIESSKLVGIEHAYPVRAIGNRGIVNPESLPPSALPNKLAQLEDAIQHGKLLRLARIGKTARFSGQEDETFEAYPLQIVFHNIAWYLGFEYKGGEKDKLLYFERLDRLRLYEVLKHSQRFEDEQRKALTLLNRLYQSCFGIFLGTSAADQRKFLYNSATMKVELWMTENIFKFVSEGTQRLPKMKMSKRPYEDTKSTDKKIFMLPKSGDDRFPYRWQATLPKWSIKDVDLKRWIIGFGGQVKVIDPPELVDLIKSEAAGIIENY